jgi:imidazolonepropionase-like amidohydrolase
MIEFWRTEGRQNGRFVQLGPYRRDMEMDFLLALVKALNDTGVIVTTGTDTAPWTEGSLPSHIHRELELLVEAGLSNFDALSAGTRNTGLIFDRMGADGSFGTVEVGQRADLILLTENPLENVSATRERVGVMVRGTWRTQEDLDAMVNEFVATY